MSPHTLLYPQGYEKGMRNHGEGYGKARRKVFERHEKKKRKHRAMVLQKIDYLCMQKHAKLLTLGHSKQA